ncbi:SLAM family member 5 [Nothobranchius furzeri]|uniref:Signaling lymphocytic activation molecule-like n=2 Tax=Nothobranchius furzeri TaxID=105023 RepID=A0A9D2YAH0_NOTFU|nr:signaling lymphocytic activation molecule-like [Nothobranchius furzeri]
MAGGRLSCFFTSSLGLLLGVYFYNAGASDGQRVIHKQVGESVELSPDKPTEGVTFARWTYKGNTVAKDHSVATENNPFQGRLEIYTNYSLKIRKLTLPDSGEFSFVSEDKDQQRPTVSISLRVHEPLTQQPNLTSRIIQPSFNGTCTVLLECKTAPDRNITYSWTVGSQTYKGPELQRSISTQDGAITFTCTITDAVSNKSASLIQTCRNQTSTNTTLRSERHGGVHIMWILTGTFGSLVLIIIILIAICGCKQRKTASDSNELTVYADVSDFTHEDRMALKPCSLYDTIENGAQMVTEGPQTVYDQIQFNRVKGPSLSPYQDLS